MDMGNDYTCNCTGNYIGPVCANIDHCAVHTPCQNSGQCVNTPTAYSCICLPGWTGKNCTDDVDECHQTSLCQNGGNCTNTDGSYNCSCAPFFTGVNCETVMSCTSNHCKNTTTGGNPSSPQWPLSTNRVIDVTVIAGLGGIFLLELCIIVGCSCIVCYKVKRQKGGQVRQKLRPFG